MNNAKKAAILLNSIGEPYATNIMSLLNSSESTIVVQEISRLTEKDILSEKQVFAEFKKKSKNLTYQSSGEVDLV